MRRFTNFKLGGVVLTLLFLLCASGNAWGQAKTYSYEFMEQTWTSFGIQNLDGFDWDLQGTNPDLDGVIYLRDFDTKKGVHIGSSGSPAKEVVLSTSSCQGIIKNIKISTSTASSGKATVSASIGGADLGAVYDLTSSNAEYSFDGGSKSGEIEIKWVNEKSTPGKGKALYIKKIEVLYEEGEVTQVAAPVLTPASGTTFVDELKVTAACATDGATIYYTTDGTDPTTSSSVFPADGLPINATTTIKAMAADGKLENSEVVTATYTKVEPLSIADFKAATGEQFLKLENAVVTAVGSNDIFIQDAEGNAIDLYRSGQDYEVGDVLNGYVKGTSTAYANMPQLTDGDYSNVTVAKGGTVSPKVVTIAELTANKETYYCSLVKIEDVTYEDGKFAKGDDALTFYNKFNAIADDYGWPSLMDVTGIFAPYNSTLQLYPRTEADIENVSGLDVPTFAWSAASYSVDINDAAGASYPTLTNNSDGTVSYESSDTEVATIDASTGAITLVGAGSTTITANVTATNNYSAASASYTLTVVDASALGEAVAFVAEKDGGYYAMMTSNTINTDRFDAIAVTVFKNQVLDVMGDRSAYSWYVDQVSGEIKSVEGEYVAYADNSGDAVAVTLQSSRYVWNYSEENGQWIASTKNDRVLGLGTSNKQDVFGAYSTSSSNAKAVAMPIVDGYTRDVTSGNYGTICLPYAVSAGDYDGVEFFSVAGKVMENGEAAAIVLNEETQLEAGKPYVFSATSDQLIAVYSGEAAAEEVEGNGLVGSFEGTDVTEGMYLLKDNTVKKVGSAGGRIAENRAYFDLSQMSEYTQEVGANQRLISLGGSNDDGTTGVEGIAAEEDALVDVYTIDGVMVRSQVAASGATDGLAKGLYIVGGKKVVVE